MDRSRSGRAHPLGILVAAMLVVFSIGLGGSALADPGQGNARRSAHEGSAGSDHGSAGSDHRSAGSDQASARSDHSEGNASTRGSYQEPQPPSNADQNDGGANGQCPGGAYCSTRDGSGSLNGKGDGEAKGKPCAGCVGKADNKNPWGQRPNASDKNAGYECDRNQGIGQTNPAHTGCGTPPPCTGDCTPPCTDGDCTPPCTDGDCTPPCTDGDCTPPCAEDDCTPPSCDTCDEGSHEHGDESSYEHGDETSGRPRAAAVLGTEAVAPGHATAAAPAGTLPATGAPPALEIVALVGLGLVLAGTTVALVRRRPGER
jgi:hypothetical protein